MGIFRKLFLDSYFRYFYRGNPRLARGQILKICVCDEHIWGSIPHASVRWKKAVPTFCQFRKTGGNSRLGLEALR